MAILNWTEQLSVNVVDIDNQHKKLIDLINNLHEAMKQGKGKDIIGNVLNELIDYTVYHFGKEEKYQIQYNYPNYIAHKAEHDKFVKKALDLKKDYESGRMVISMEVLSFLQDWVRDHIQKTDKQYSAYFNEKGLH